MTEKQVKAAVRERDGYRCVDCGINRSKLRKLDVHRLTTGSAYTLEGCVTVCIPCHRKRHASPDMDIKGILEKHGLSWGYLAINIGVSEDAVRKWVKGGKPSRTTQDRIHKFLKSIGRPRKQPA